MFLKIEICLPNRNLRQVTTDLPLRGEFFPQMITYLDAVDKGFAGTGVTQVYGDTEKPVIFCQGKAIYNFVDLVILVTNHSTFHRRFRHIQVA